MLDISSRPLAPALPPDFLAGGGEMGESLRAVDWTRTHLGPARDWPTGLKIAVRMLLASRQPMCLLWGGAHLMIYNDACRALLGQRHAAMLAQPAATACSDFWQAAGHRVELALHRNEGTYMESVRFVDGRDAGREQPTYGVTFTPVPGDPNSVGGVLCAFNEELPEAARRARVESRPNDDQRLASEAELAVARNQLADEVETLTSLHNLAMRLGGMTQLEPALQAVLDTAVEAQRAHFGLIWVYDAETDTLRPRASHGFDEHGVRYFDRIIPGPSGGGAGNAFARRCRWAIEDTETDESFLQFREGARRAGFRSVHSTPIVTRSGELLGVLSVHFRQPRLPSQRDMQIADVCARHAADAIEVHRNQDALLRSERIHRAIGESLDYGVWTANREGRVTYLSESFLKLVGCTLSEWNREGLQRIVHPEDLSGLTQAWKVCVCEGRSFDHEFRVRGPGRKWHSVLGRAVPMRDEHGEVCGWAGINLDIQRLKQVEHELRELDQRKNEFLATLAHELRNPLAPLRNGLEVLRIASDNKAMAEKARSMMERQLHQMVRLVDDLLDVSRVSRGKIELRRDNVELAAVLRNAIETSQPLMTERGHDLVARIPQDKIVVYADMTRLSQVFWNLLNNAAKYTEVGGRIELEVRMLGGSVAVTVRDNGIGIPADMLSRVFDIFTQVDRSLEKSQGGLGIGLSIARRLVEMHGGAIEVKSDGHGRGSEFTVTLPAAVVPLAAEIPSGAAAPAGVRAMACKRILIADDNTDSATTLSIMLEMLGNEVRVAHDGEEAVRAAEEFKPDAILLDIGMPKMNGYDACARLRANAVTGKAFMVALTGWGQEEDRNRAHAAGFDHHLVKPVEPATLEKLIAELPARR